MAAGHRQDGLTGPLIIREDGGTRRGRVKEEGIRKNKGSDSEVEEEKREPGDE